MTGHPRFAFDCHRRFLEGFGSTVLGIDPAAFKKRRDELIASEHVDVDAALDSEAMERLAAEYQRIIVGEHHAVPDEPMEQLRAAAEAVYRSWMSDRAVTYRRLQHFEDLRGTAVTVQAMVFGNSGLSSGAGVAFSRDPSNGADTPVIDVLFDAQGEDVVSGRQTPETEDAIAHALPAVTAQLRAALARLEQAFGDVQDVEFTIEDDKLWILQTRAAKRTPRAALRFALDFVREGRIAPADALRRLGAIDTDKLVNTRLIAAGPQVLSGTAASPGIAVGRAAFDPAGAERLAGEGDPVILLRPDTSTADVAGFAAASGIVTALGGRTAHAALVARQMGKPCIVGCSGLAIDLTTRSACLPQAAIREDDWLSVDGGSGAIYLGRGQIVTERPDEELAQLERWRAEERNKSLVVT